MEADRTEMHDLAATHPELTSKMAAQYDQWARERGVVPFGSWNKAKPGAKGRKAKAKN